MIGQTINRYRIVSQLGEGGMGAVFEAVDETGRHIAIKVLHKEHASNQQIALRFINEARAISVVNHPGIVEVYETGQHTDGSAFIAMELLKGETLSVRMKKSPNGKMPVLECVRLGRQIASALAAAHAKTIVHRDLKPDNIMIVPDANVPGVERSKLLDFGIAKVKQEYQANDQLQTRAGVMMGTPLYMSPEQCKNAGDVDDKADVYSLGVMLYRMLAGKPPFQAAGTGELMAMHIYMQPQPLQEIDPVIPEPLRDLVHKMLAKQRQDRPSMAQVEQELEKVNVKVSGLQPAIRLPQPVAPPANQPSQVGAAEAKTVISEGVPPLGLPGENRTVVQTETDGKTVMPTPLGQTGPGKKRWLRIALFAFATLCMLGVLVWLVSFEKTKTPVKDPTGPKTPTGQNTTGGPGPIQPVKVKWHIDSDPQGAQVYEQGKSKELGTTPCDIEWEPKPGQVTLEVKLDGYKPKQISVMADASQTPNVVKLEKADDPPKAGSKGSKGGSKNRPKKK